MVIFVSDLDNTLIHSYKAADKNDICVEWKDKKELSFMSEYSYDLLNRIYNNLNFIPITTRSIEQYNRISFFKNNCFPKYAVTSNGGILLENNIINEKWRQESKAIVSDGMQEIKKGHKILSSDSNIIFEIRLVDEMFLFTKSKEPDLTVNKLKDNLNNDKVDVYSNGIKIYIVPKGLNKGTALLRIKEYLNSDYVICAGDSEFDISMLKIADDVFIPDSRLFDFSKQKCNINIPNSSNKRFADFILKTVFNKYVN